MSKAKNEIGQSSVLLAKPIYISQCASIAGTKEGEGPLAGLFDVTLTDDKYHATNWDDAESRLQKEAVSIVLKKAKLDHKQVRYLFAGDLLGQSIASSFGLLEFEIPYFGLYGACSTCGEALSLASMVLSGGFSTRAVCVTSSHFASAEKEFRFPLEYGTQRSLSATWTVTGAGAFLLETFCDLGVEANGEVLAEANIEKQRLAEKAYARITAVTTGRILDLGIKDSMNMGCAMAPAAANTIRQHFEDFHRKPSDYDAIITGDLGKVGSRALTELLLTKGYDISKKHTDCGMLIFDIDTQEVGAGGSGCGCSAVTLASYILPKLRRKEWKKVLFVPTGALLSKTSFNEGNSIPGIAHAVVLESV